MPAVPRHTRIDFHQLMRDANGAPHPDSSAYARKFSGKYAHWIFTGGVARNLPQEALQAFAEAVIAVDGY